ncbi:MAG: aminotransferase class V-fold PLP-dependent enzyme [Eubacteriales bacterium]|nr:aminotransferase class V-fold PLP-dependent enzyme [Eubacteriales bacterium]MDD3200018.1 aminotransferase class V-fold PLP-dependent enzyme [Eubacteriales bacterium]MDD4629959.1 aminotransferase class V-fold PLP-dependent enzyme [Eubacteriales bacterium]
MIYLDNAATSFPKPKGMLRVMNECIQKYCGNPGRSGHGMSIKTGEEIYKARKEVGKLFGIDDCSRIIFTANTTESLNLGIKGVLNRGDHAITTSMEHNSVLRPLKTLEASGVETTIVKCRGDGTLNLEKLKNEIKNNTKIIVCTHASNVTGTIMPIKELGQLAKKENLIFMVDAAQSAGCLPINVKDMNIDLLAVPGHKGLLGPMGTGMLFVKEGVNLRPLKEGGTGTKSKELIHPWDYPEGYEAGTVNAPGIIGLGYSIKYIAGIGIENIMSYEEELIRILDESLRNMKRITVYGPTDCREKTGIVTFNYSGAGCEEICDMLYTEYGIASRGGFHCAGQAHKTIGTHDIGAVRLSVGPSNTKKDIYETIEAIYKLRKI